MVVYEYETEEERLNRIIRNTIKFMWTFVFVVILCVVCNFYLFTLVKISSESMYPTLKAKDTAVMLRKYTVDRGDIIVFLNPEHTEQKYLTKRVIGLPGDVIEIKNKLMYINDQLYEEEYFTDDFTADYFKITVPADSYFVMGDNRNNSRDSRHFGCVSSNAIVGKIKMILLPIHRIRVF